VESGFFSLSKPGLNFLTSSIRQFIFSVYSTTAWFASYRKHRGGSNLRVSQTCIAAGQNPSGLGRDFGGRLLARVVIPRFREKAKENRHTAWFCSVLNLFAHHELQPRGRTETLMLDSDTRLRRSAKTLDAKKALHLCGADYYNLRSHLPVPVRLEACGLLLALSATLNSAVLVPVAVRVNTTLMVQLVLAARLVPQAVVETLKPRSSRSRYC
jgi:hypothetical protein